MKDLVVVKKENLIEEFLTNYTSENTRKAYRKDILDFFNFFRNQGIQLSHPIEITHDFLINYRDHLIQSMTPASVHRKVISIKKLLDWCIYKQHIQINPASVLRLPKNTPTNPTLALSDEEASAFLRAPDASSFYGNLHLMILSSLLILGLRRSELVNIKLKDIYQDRGHEVLKIRGKGDKTRYIPLNRIITHYLSDYKNTYTKLSGNELLLEDYLLQSRLSEKNDKPYDADSIRKVIIRYTKKLKINKRISPHSFRATTISHLLEIGESPRNVADFAGHANINTTISLYDKKRDNLENSSAYKVMFGNK